MKEKLWIERLEKYSKDYKCNYGVCVVGGWLEYDDEQVTTSQINYYLNKSVLKGILKIEKNKSYTKFYLLNDERKRHFRN